MKTTLPQRSRKLYKILYVCFYLMVFLFFIYLYVYPNSPRSATNYSTYLIFNFILFTLFIFTIPNAFFYLLHIIFTRRKAPVFPFMGIIISFSIAASMVFGTIAGTRQVKAEHVTLYYSNLPEQFTGYKIFLFTDTHLGGIQNPKPLFNKAQKILAASNPDMILFAGDLVNNFANEVPGNEHFFKRLNENRKSYSILGNHDYGDYTDWENDEEKEANFRALIEAHGELGFTLLRNENVSIVKQNDTIFLAGVENWGHPPFPQYADLEAAIQGIPPGAFTILLTHDPAHWESKIRNQENIELTLSGHTHGMQWGIKIAGIPFSLAYLSRKYWGGLYKSGNSALYVNTGFGTVGVPWRLDMPAEVTILTLERLKVD